MYYKINQILEYISQHMTLNVGDLILTGTPHGVGPIRVLLSIIHIINRKVIN